jgi:hypothetical protein
MTDQERITELEKEIVDLRARLPKHSIPMRMLVELEELEDELAAIKARMSRDTA